MQSAECGFLNGSLGRKAAGGGSIKWLLVAGACGLILTDRPSHLHVVHAQDTASFLGVISVPTAITGAADSRENHLRETGLGVSDVSAVLEGVDLQSRFRSLPDYRDWWLSPAALRGLGCKMIYSPQQMLQRKSLNLKFGDFKSYTGEDHYARQYHPAGPQAFGTARSI
jgi:hypothetical protein